MCNRKRQTKNFTSIAQVLKQKRKVERERENSFIKKIHRGSVHGKKKRKQRPVFPHTKRRQTTIKKTKTKKEFFLFSIERNAIENSSKREN